MKILNNTNYYKNNIYTNFNYTNQYYSNNYVTFTGKNTVPKPVKKTVDTVVKQTKRHIKNSLYAELNKETQNTIENIRTNLDNIKLIYDKIAPNIIQKGKLKQGYDKLVVIPKRKGHTFKIEEENLNLTILPNKNTPRLLRLVVDKDNQTTHFLLDGNDKAVSNLNKKQPFILPPNLRYMTNNEIETSQIKKYITLADKSIRDYMEYLTNKAIAKGKTVKLSSPANLDGENIKILTELFNKNDIQNLPESAKILTSKNGNLLSLTVKLENGSDLKISKKMSSEYGEALRYLSLEETLNDGSKKFLSIDLQTNEFLKTKTNGAPIVKGNMVLSYTPTELNETKISETFESYIKQIVEQSKNSQTTNTREISIVPDKHTTKNINEISLEDIEDININKLAEKDAIKEEINTSETKTSKKANSLTNFEEEMNVKLGNLKEKAVQKATEDAKVFVDTYLKTFSEQVQLNIDLKLTELAKQLKDFLKSFTN